MFFMTFSELIDLIKESGVKEYKRIVYNDNTWMVGFNQLGDKNKYIACYGNNFVENIYIVPNQQKNNYDKHMLELIIKGDDYDNVKHIEMVHIPDDSEEDIIKDE